MATRPSMMSKIRELERRSVAVMSRIREPAIRKYTTLTLRAKLYFRSAHWDENNDHYFDVYLEGHQWQSKRLYLTPSDNSHSSYDISFGLGNYDIDFHRDDGPVLGRQIICSGDIGPLHPNGSTTLLRFYSDAHQSHVGGQNLGMMLQHYRTGRRTLLFSSAKSHPRRRFVWTRLNAAFPTRTVPDIGLGLTDDQGNDWVHFQNNMPKVLIHKRSKVGRLYVCEGNLLQEVEDIVVASCMAVLMEGEPGWKRLAR
ncbi:hypothetical protein BU16DRAFT_561269 [Lophium mytilinum]|uniref:Uncharacterized protein n=1 Tax=Lophium mytilinum TaxID=390894 RepID=A0A6A6QVN2_9PEZI|nr:hypothetical protein BU16DRAFT_561269 [Lophium mytilinum]